MTRRTTKTGKQLERQVANAYRAMGARKVEHDVELAGHQIDVYVEMETADRALHRIAVEAHDYEKPVGIDIVSHFSEVVGRLRRVGYVDEGVVVSTAGFSKVARNAAQEYGLRLLEPLDLEAVVGIRRESMLVTRRATKTGRALELQVADAYRAVGARKVEQDVELAGLQVDVYVEMETADHSLHRIVVEAKDYAKPVGIKILRDFTADVSMLRHFGYVDEGVIVSAAGFSRQARNLAREENIRLLEPVDLEAMAARELNLSQMHTNYLASLRQRFEYLDLGGVAPRLLNRTVKLRMEDLFVPLQARPNETELVEIRDLLRSQRAVVLGDPGSGKSTLLRFVAHAVACGRAKSVGAAVLERLPIFVRVAQFCQEQKDNPTLTLDSYIREVSEPRWASLFQQALDSGQALVLLDGLDDVVNVRQRRSVAQAIQTLVAHHPDNAFIVTSRIAGYRADQLSNDFTHYTIQPLSMGHIAKFAEMWYAAIGRKVRESEVSEEAQEPARDLIHTIQERPSIRRLAENPLLLTIIALIHWSRRRLPNRRVELYAHAAETLIESWPYRRQAVELDAERVARLLSAVAYRIFATQPSGTTAENDVMPILINAICNIDGVGKGAAEDRARKFLTQVSERSGIFRESGYDEQGRQLFAFLHFTFTEYFAARYLASLWEGIEDADARCAFLRNYTHVPRWREVVLLMAGDVGLRDDYDAKYATRLLRDILTLGSEYEDQLHRDLVLAGQCLADDLRVQTPASNYVLDKLLELASKPGVGDAIQDIFYAMRETVYVQPVVDGLLAQLEDSDWIVRRRAAEILGQIGDPRAVDGLANRLEDSNGDVRDRAAEALRSIGGPQATEALLAWMATAGLSVELISGGVMLTEVPNQLVLAVTNNSIRSIDKAEIEVLPSAEYRILSSNPIVLSSLYPRETREVNFIIHPRVALEIPIDLKINGELRDPALRIVAMRDNPYVYGNPVDNEMLFFGRRRELHDIFQAVTKPNKQDILLVGERRSGKTSLLYQLERQLRPPFIPVYVVLNEAPASVAGVIELIVRRIADHLIKEGILPHDRWSSFQSSYETLTDSLEPILRAVRDYRPEARMVLLADEADHLLDIEIRLQNVLRAALQSQKIGSMLAAVFAGTSSLRTYVTQRSSPLFNQFRFVSLRPLNVSETQDLITKPAEALGRKYDPVAVENIRLASGGHPYYCQRICYEAFALVLESGVTTIDNRISEAAISRVIASSSDDAFVGFKTYFWDAASLNERDYMRQLASSRRGRTKSSPPDRLVNWQVIKMEGEEYGFTARLFREWVKRLEG